MFPKKEKGINTFARNINQVFHQIRGNSDQFSNGICPVNFSLPSPSSAHRGIVKLTDECFLKHIEICRRKILGCKSKALFLISGISLLLKY